MDRVQFGGMRESVRYHCKSRGVYQSAGKTRLEFSTEHNVKFSYASPSFSIAVLLGIWNCGIMEQENENGDGAGCVSEWAFSV